MIPARGGSKRLEKKNIVSFCGKPLVAYTIEAALKSHFITRTIVSTEDDEIAEISRSYGAEVLKRPDELAKDETPTNDVILHVLEKLKSTERYIPTFLVLLQPTSPLRTTDDIDKAIEQFRQSRNESLISVTQYDHSPYWAFTIKKGLLTSVFGDSKLKRSQEVPPLYRPNGALYITRTETFQKYKSFYTKQMTPFLMPRERSIDIDDELDLVFAELIYKHIKS
jgi:CMP-N-acetylneuraminic acid synthetase